MAKHIVLIGFSCTGKTSLGKDVFQGATILDSDDEILEWIACATQTKYNHIYQLYMNTGRTNAIKLIEQAEAALVTRWASDSAQRIISLGPGFPLREGWKSLRAASNVVLFRRTAEGIYYDSLLKRRSDIFRECPDAKSHDNWDVGVIVDEQRNEYPRGIAIGNITRLIADRERFYSDNDAEVVTDDRESAKRELQSILKRFES